MTTSTSSNPGSTLNGFILTRQWVESASGIELVFWMATEQGPLRLSLGAQEVVCFFPSCQQDEVEALLAKHSGWRIAPTQLRSFHFEPISALYFKSQRKLFNCRDRLCSSGVRIAEADIKPTDRFLMERFITAAVALEGKLLKQKGFFRHFFD